MTISETTLRTGELRLDYKDSRGYRGVVCNAYSNASGTKWTMFIIRGIDCEKRTFKERTMMTKWVKSHLMK